MERVNFTQMKDGGREEYTFLMALEQRHADGTADRLMDALLSLEDGLSGYRISRLRHSTQAATRAWRDGADVDWVVSALLHDIGDLYAPYNHDEFAASILRPFIREQCAWVVGKHANFQLVYFAHHLGWDPNRRETWRDHPYFDDCVAFCELWDQSSFDPDYDDLPLEFFRPMVREVFARRAYDPTVIRAGEHVPLRDVAVGDARRAA